MKTEKPTRNVSTNAYEKRTEVNLSLLGEVFSLKSYDKSHANAIYNLDYERAFYIHELHKHTPSNKVIKQGLEILMDSIDESNQSNHKSSPGIVPEHFVDFARACGLVGKKPHVKKEVYTKFITAFFAQKEPQPLYVQFRKRFFKGEGHNNFNGILGYPNYKSQPLFDLRGEFDAVVDYDIRQKLFIDVVKHIPKDESMHYELDSCLGLLTDVELFFRILPLYSGEDGYKKFLTNPDWIDAVKNLSLISEKDPAHNILTGKAIMSGYMDKRLFKGLFPDVECETMPVIEEKQKGGIRSLLEKYI